MGNKGKLIVGLSEQSADLLYVTGFMAGDPFIFFESDGDKYIVVSALEYDRACKESKPDIKVLDRDEISAPSCSRNIENTLLAITQKYSSYLWEVPETFPYYYAEFLKKHGVNITCENCDLFPQRRTKTEIEIQYIKEAMRITQHAMHEAELIFAKASVDENSDLKYNGEKLTSEFIKNAINMEVINNGAFPFGTIVASGLQSAIPHDTGSGVIKQGVPVIIDIFPRVEKTGYYGDMTRTFVKGQPDNVNVVRQAYSTVKKAKDYVKSAISAGTVPDKLQKEVLDIFSEAGFKTGKKNNRYFGFFHSLGHGLGLEVHELPKCGLFVTEPLQAGDVLAIEPGLYYPEWGGVRLEDVIIVSEHGNESITNYPDILEIP